MGKIGKKVGEKFENKKRLKKVGRCVEKEIYGPVSDNAECRVDFIVTFAVSSGSFILVLAMSRILILMIPLLPLLLGACFQGWVVPAGVVKVSLAGHSCADIIVAARPGQPRPDSAVYTGGETAPVGRRLPGGEELLHSSRPPQSPQTRLNLCSGSG